MPIKAILLSKTQETPDIWESWMGAGDAVGKEVAIVSEVTKCLLSYRKTK